METITLKIDEDQEDALNDVMAGLEKALGCKVCMAPSHVYVVESDDPKALAILESVFGETAIVHKAEMAKKQAKNARRLPENLPGEKIHRAHHTRQDLKYIIVSGPDQGTELFAMALRKKLRVGNIAEGTRLSHPKKGDFVVVHGELVHYSGVSEQMIVNAAHEQPVRDWEPVEALS
jgi:hypothetical protein